MLMNSNHELRPLVELNPDNLQQHIIAPSGAIIKKASFIQAHFEGECEKNISNAIYDNIALLSN